MKHLAYALVLLTVCSLLSGCQDRLPDTYVINGFELDSDLDRLNWKCHTLFSLSQEHVTFGQSCLLMSMYPPSDYPGVSFSDYIRDWSPYSRLSLDVFNPESQGELYVTFRIDDNEDAPEYEDRVNRRLLLKPGMNHVVFPLNGLMTPSGRPLDLSHIHALMMFMVKPNQKFSLFVDHVCLTKD